MDSNQSFQNTPFPERPPKNKRGLWVFLILLVILCAGVVGTVTVGKKVYRHFFPREVPPPPAPLAQNTVRFTEGWSVLKPGDLKDVKTGESVFTEKEIAQALTEAQSEFDFFGEKVKPKNLEGYLFPDTYFVIKEDGPKIFIETMLGTMGKKITSQMRSDIAKNKMSIYETLIMASLIEKEVGRNLEGKVTIDSKLLEEERKLVASVFYNRLNIGMPLQSDATVNYAMGRNTRNVTLKDLEFDSRYNTYKYNGLPPGPIGNPSLSSIMAAIYPSESDYIYFLSKPDGTAVFSRTLDEHNTNKARYLR